MPNYSLSKDDTFTKVTVIFTRVDTEVIFTTSESKYLENTNYFFRTNIFSDLNFEEKQRALNSLSAFTNFPPIEIGKDTAVNVEIDHPWKNRYEICFFFNLRNDKRDYAPQLDEKIRKELKKDSR